MTLLELTAASTLIVRLERICSKGMLSPAEEQDTRQIIVDAYKAFGFPSMGEHSETNVIDLEKAAGRMMRKEMERAL